MEYNILSMLKLLHFMYTKFTKCNKCSHFILFKFECKSRQILVHVNIQPDNNSPIA